MILFYRFFLTHSLVWVSFCEIVFGTCFCMIFMSVNMRWVLMHDGFASTWMKQHLYTRLFVPDFQAVELPLTSKTCMCFSVQCQYQTDPQPHWQLEPWCPHRDPPPGPNSPLENSQESMKLWVIVLYSVCTPTLTAVKIPFWHVIPSDLMDSLHSGTAVQPTQDI